LSGRVLHSSEEVDEDGKETDDVIIAPSVAALRRRGESITDRLQRSGSLRESGLEEAKASAASGIAARRMPRKSKSMVQEYLKSGKVVNKLYAAWDKGTKAADWRNSHSEVRQRNRSCDAQAAAAGVVGAILIALQNEVVLLGADPRMFEVNVLKGLSLVCNMFLLRLLYTGRWLEELSDRHEAYATKGIEISVYVSFQEVFSRWESWLEIFVFVPVLPPGITFEVSNTDMKNVVVYRAEIVCALSILPRLFLLWKPFAEWYLSGKKFIVW